MLILPCFLRCWYRDVNVRALITKGVILTITIRLNYLAVTETCPQKKKKKKAFPKSLCPLKYTPHVHLMNIFIATDKHRLHDLMCLWCKLVADQRLGAGPLGLAGGRRSVRTRFG